jgi:hypothetical protein
MKVEKKPESFDIPGYLLELIINIWQFENFFFSKFGEFVPFFPWKILGQNSIFEVEIWQNFTKKKTIECEPDN